MYFCGYACLCVLFGKSSATTWIYTYCHTLSLHAAMPIYPAHARREAAFNHGDLHGAWLDHRHCRYRAGCTRRCLSVAQYRDLGADPRTADAPPVPCARRLLHQRLAVAAEDVG